MFPRRKRLSRAEFPAAIRGGRRFTTINLIAIVPEKTIGYAVVVSKKTARLSVTRHKIKRLVWEALRGAETSVSLPPALILLPKSTTKEISHRGLKEEMEELLSKINI